MDLEENVADGQHRGVLQSITLMNTLTHLVNLVMGLCTLLDLHIPTGKLPSPRICRRHIIITRQCYIFQLQR